MVDKHPQKVVHLTRWQPLPQGRLKNWVGHADRIGPAPSIKLVHQRAQENLVTNKEEEQKQGHEGVHAQSEAETRVGTRQCQVWWRLPEPSGRERDAWLADREHDSKHIERAEAVAGTLTTAIERISWVWESIQYAEHPQDAKVHLAELSPSARVR